MQELRFWVCRPMLRGGAWFGVSWNHEIEFHSVAKSGTMFSRGMETVDSAGAAETLSDQSSPSIGTFPDSLGKEPVAPEIFKKMCCVRSGKEMEPMSRPLRHGIFRFPSAFHGPESEPSPYRPRSHASFPEPSR